MTGPSQRTAAESPRRLGKFKVDWLHLWLISPAALLMAVLLLYPIAKGVQLSFFKIKLLQLRSGGTFIGLDNYVRLFQDPNFWNALRVTALYSLGVVAGAYLIGLAVAFLMDQKLPARGLLRTLMVIPWAVPEVVAVLIFVWMLDAQYGVLNYFLLQLGAINEQIPWLVEARYALPAVILVTIWKQFPLAALILLAGLQTIPDEQYEAAKIDGANGLQRFRFITWPGLRSVNTVLLLILILYSFRRVTLIYVMTGGGPARATETLSIQTYTTAFQYQDLGYASAIGTVLLLFLLLFTLVYFRVTGTGRGGQG